MGGAMASWGVGAINACAIGSNTSRRTAPTPHTLYLQTHTHIHTQVLRRREANGVKSAFVGYGPETLQPGKLTGFVPGVSSLNAYGAHFAIELNEVPRGPDVSFIAFGWWRWVGLSMRRSMGFIKPNQTQYQPTMTLYLILYQGDIPLLDPGTAVAYLQLAVPNLRISKLLGTYVRRCVRGFPCEREPSLVSRANLHLMSNKRIAYACKCRGRRPGPLGVRLGAGGLPQRAHASGDCGEPPGPSHDAGAQRAKPQQGRGLL